MNNARTMMNKDAAIRYNILAVNPQGIPYLGVDETVAYSAYVIWQWSKK